MTGVATSACWSTMIGMTIAEHCLRLLRESGPLTAEELGRSCAAAGLTNAKDPALSVGGSLSWNTDGRAVRLEDGRLALVTALLEGRWLTTPAPAHGRPLDPGLDLNPLRGPVARDGVELLSGGTVGSPWWSHPWTGPPGWLPATGDDGLLGFRLRDGLLEVAEVGLGDDAAARGHALAERVLALAPKSVASSYYCDRKLSRALLQVLHGDPDALREPVPPLRTLLPSGQSHQGPAYGGPGRLPGYADGVLLTLTLP
jgi:hypothetical protein